MNHEACIICKKPMRNSLHMVEAMVFGGEAPMHKKCEKNMGVDTK